MGLGLTMREKVQPIADIPRNVRIIATLSLVTLAVALVTLAVVVGKGGK